MRIDGQLPIHIARAYGIASPTRPGAIRPAATPQSTRESSSVHAAPRPGEFGAERLVAGRVSGQVDFNGSATRDPNAAGTLQLYTRAADKLEAAVGIHLGRTLDMQG